MKEEPENSKTSQNFIINFYYIVQQLINAYSEYEELILEIEGFKKENSEMKIDEDQQTNIKNANKYMRKLITQTQLQYSTLNYGGEKENDKVLKTYKEVSKDYLLDRDKLKAYIIEINKYTLDRIMPHISVNTDMSNIYQ